MRELRSAISILLFMTIMMGGLYPLVITGLGTLIFSENADGSLINRLGYGSYAGSSRQGVIVGSTLIGQSFTKDQYFHSRPSAAGQGYDAMASSASNLGPTSRKLHDEILARINDAKNEQPGLPIPADMVTASASGLDPDITPENALFQAARVAKARHMSEARMRDIINHHTEPRTLGIFGQPRVNVLLLNIALDDLSKK